MSDYGMERLPFRLHDFTRWSWVSDPARYVWEPRLAAIGAAWQEVEWLSVAQGMRGCTLRMVQPAELAPLESEMSRYGLCAGILSVMRAAANYTTMQTEAQPGEPFQYWIALGRPADVEALQAAWAGGDQNTVGRLLGYPACCRAFFQRVWVEGGFIDTTWPMAVNSAAPDQAGAHDVEVNGPPEANILLRWLGVRAVPHLPCAFDCPHTVDQARDYLRVGRDHSHHQAMTWLEAMLNWPVEWSALHGIAEIKTPVVKITAVTDATPQRYTVRRPGADYPDEGAQGLSFPYAAPDRRRLSESRGYQQALAQPIALLSHQPDWYFTDNGFSSEVAMDLAHRPIVDRVARSISAGALLDLGCGNGALLARIVKDKRAIIPYGVEWNPQRLAHVRDLLPDFAAHFTQGDLFAVDAPWERDYTCVLLMAGRLAEVPPEIAQALLDKIARHAQHLILYAYGDTLAVYGDLPALAQRFGLTLIDHDGGPVALAKADRPATG
jgi:SAM-dependent methyltransferase